jgi:hypothetical protein
MTVSTGMAACGGDTIAPLVPVATGPLQLVALTATTVSGVGGTLVIPPPAVRVVDERGAPVSRVMITFELASAHGIVVGPTVASDAAGEARPVSWTLGPLSTTSVVRARLSANPMTGVEFTATTFAGPASHIILVSGDRQNGMVGEPLPDSLFVKVTDSYRNPVAGVNVTFSVEWGDGSIGGAATTDSGGVASPGRWTLGPVPMGQQVVATIDGARLQFSANGYERCAADCAPAGPVAFVRNGDIYLMNTDGTGLAQLTTGANSSEPAWSPDGRRIAFARSTTRFSDLYMMDADGSNVRRFAVDASSPAWSPDGSQLTYAALRDGGLKILVGSVDDDSSPTITIGFDRGFNGLPAWSPDGKRIAFVADWDAFDFAMEVYTVKPDGSDVRQLTSGFYGAVSGWPTYTTYRQPAWSPDGSQLAIVTCEEWQYYSCANSSLAVMATDGSGLRTIAATTGYARPVWISGGAVAYSVTCRLDSCVPGVFVIPSEGGNAKLLIANAGSAVWRP